MNLTALLIALFGATIVIIGFYFGRKTENRVKANAIKIAGSIGGFFSLAVFPVDNLETTGLATQYLMVILVVVAIVNIFIKKSN